MSAIIARPLMRSSAMRTVARSGARFESTNTQKATEAAKSTVNKASEGLSRVTSSAGPAIAGAAKGVAGALGKVGGRTGRLVAFVEKNIPFAIYYARVGLEVSKIVIRGQKMSPPPYATFQSYYQGALNTLKNPNSLASAASQSAGFAQRLRTVNTAALVSGGVVAAELLGFFTVGEMIGRFKLVGYHGEVESAHH